jgi:hypothetical protein
LAESGRQVLAHAWAAIGLAENTHALQPVLELWGRFQAQALPGIERIVEGGGLVVEHHIVGAGDAHDEVDPRHAEQGEQHVHVVLIGFGVIGVADVAAHRQAQQLAAEVVFQAGTDDLLAVVEVLGADKTDHGVDQKRFEMAGHRVGAGLAGLLVEAMVRAGRERTALAGFKVHEVVAEGAAFEAQAGVVAFLQHLEADAEAGVGGLGAGNRLEH